MSISVASFRLKFPAFASTTTYPDSIVSDRISDAAQDVNLDWFGDRSDRATMLLAAHFLVFNGGGVGVTGAPVSSVSAGSASISYAVGSQLDSALMSTSYGREFKRLMKICGPAMNTVFNDCA